jgi:hypothetical protein
MDWCCNPFRNAVENRLDDGQLIYAVSPRAAEGDPGFGFAFRAVRADNLPLRKELSEGAPGNVKLSGSWRIRFCPWCGVKLAEFYRTSYKDLVDENVIREFEFV